MTTCDR